MQLRPPKVLKVKPCIRNVCTGEQKKNTYFANFKNAKNVGNFLFEDVTKNNSRKQSKQRARKYFKWIFFSLILLAIIIIIPISILITNHFSNSNICKTTSCIQSTSVTLKYLNTAVDPCNDFYEFACGNFPKTVRLTEDKPYQSVLTLMLETVEHQVHELLDQLQTENQPNYYKQLKKFYNLCVNWTYSKKEETENINSILKYLGDWPIIKGSNWNENNFDLLKIIQMSRQLGILHEHFITVLVEPDIKNTTKFLIIIKVKETLASPVVIDSEFPLNSFTKDIIIKLALLYGANYTVANDHANEIQLFETKLHWLFTQIDDETEIRSNIMKLQSIFLEINWTKLIENTINDPNVVITGEENVLIISFKRFITLINLLRVTPKRVQANYIFLEIVRWVNQKHALFNNTNRRTVACSLEISNSMNIAVSAIYVKKYKNPKTKTEVTQIWLNIQKEFENAFKSSHWLDELTINNALEKLKHIKTCVAYPDELLDDEIIEKYYNELNINYTTYLNAIMSINRFQQDKMYKRLRQYVQHYLWIENSAKVLNANADYNYVLNNILLPAAFLQDPVFNVDRPRYMNYAVMGMIIGHEIMRGFDQYNMNPQTQCITSQYDNYVIPNTNLKINGTLTKSVNIGDNCGLKLSHVAYYKWTNLNGKEDTLPGLKFTTEQLFWIIYSQFWCSHSFEAHLKYLLTLRQTPNKYRVILPLSNNKNFSGVFNCPLGSPMNPEKKCEVC